jgi:hypothetical protein
LNTYSYVSANPVNATDSLGLLELKFENVDAFFIDHLKKIKSTTRGKALFETIRNIPQEVYILTTDACSEKEANITIHGKNKITVLINPNSNLSFTSDQGPKKFSITRILAHELGHVVGEKDSPSDYGSYLKDMFTGSQTYRMDNIKTWENPIMAPLEGYNRIRYEPIGKLKCDCTKQ